MTVGKYDLPLGVPAEFYVCWELPDQRDLPASANQKRKRTLEETNNFKAVRTIKACLRCRRLKIKVSELCVFLLFTDILQVLWHGPMFRMR
jgi:hypothetical protein